MKMTKASDYALVLLARLEQSPKEEWISVREMAEDLGIPGSFLGNIVHQLVQSGILLSHRGVKGGIKLAKTSSEITVGSVLEAMHDPMGLVDCMEQPGQCALENHCDVQKFWSVSHSLILAALKHITLKEITSYFKKGLPAGGQGERHAIAIKTG
ncbi:MAG: Rrf2 family transcriptional regulator [Deltaproteobacteria bacterium]|nr:Rrf2 family transcriptional regulator [Deltaproteobacteria bacterium]